MFVRMFRTLGGLGAVATLVTTVGCSSTPLTPPTATAQMDADDAAQQVAMTMSQGSGGSPQAIAVLDDGGSMFARGTAPAQVEGAPPTSDTTFVVGNVTWTLSRTFYDALDVVQGSFNPVTTVRMTATSRGVGSIETPSDTASLGSAGSLDIRGLSTTQDTLITGAAVDDTLLAAFTPPLRGGRVHLYTVRTGALSQVRQLKPVFTNPWPLSGTATWTLHVSRLRSSDRGDVLRTFDATVVVTFNGTRFPDVTVTGNFHYKIDLVTGGIQRV
jgi:hypothetical protein